MTVSYIVPVAICTISACMIVVGKVYKYYPKSRMVEWITNKPTGVDFPCEIVLVFDDANKFFGMMPTECLDFT